MIAFTAQRDLDLGDVELTTISKMVHTSVGIVLDDTKRELVRGRLAKRVRALGLPDFASYITRLQRDKDEFSRFIDALTTNKTSFFRERPHFDRLQAEWSKPGERPRRIWSAGCSTGEEPYTLGIVLHGLGLGDGSTRILATDVCSRVLETARAGTYDADVIEPVPPADRTRHFTRTKEADGSARFRVSPSLTKLIQFARLNLMGEWPMKGPFDAILCRNVMIYFDGPTREWLVERYASLLRPGGLLLIGMSESLSRRERFTLVEPGVYRRAS